MKNAEIYIGSLILALLFPCFVQAENTDDNFLRLERSQQNDAIGLQVTSLGVFGLNAGKIGHVELSYIESDIDGDGLALEFGGGASYHAGATFFLGIGFTLGYNSDRNDFMNAYYPEVGVLVQITKKLGLIATGKRYYSLYDSVDGENIVMLGLLFGGD